MRSILFVIFLAWALTGCGAGFAMERPEDFVALDDAASASRGYALRATSAEGVVVAVRALDNERHGSRDFWVQAIRNRLRRDQGYALTSESDVAAASGEQGHQMRFGHDDASGRPYVYWVTVFVTDARIYVVEAGGRRDQFEPATAEVEHALGTFRIE